MNSSVPDLAALQAALDEQARLYLCPTGLVSGPAAEALCRNGAARALAGSSTLAWTACEVWLRRGSGRLLSASASLAALETWIAGLGPPHSERLALWLERSARAKPVPAAPGAKPAPPGPCLMGIVNVTPDSFSDGGEALDPGAALARIERQLAEGAALVDIGAHSTRPGAEPVSEREEMRRLAPVLAAISESGLARRAALSIDTTRASVMAAALESGFALVNDVSALTAEPASLPLLAGSGAAAVLMHRPGDDTEPSPGGERHAALEVYDGLEARVAACEAAGLPRARLLVDPGIAFGKSGADNVAILRCLALLQGLDCPVLLGVSRKGLTGAHHRRHAPGERLPGSLAVAVQALDRGVQMLRVHDVAETGQALEVWRLLAGGADPGLVAG